MDSLQLEADEATNQDTELTAEGVATPIKGDVPNSPAPAEETVKFFNQASLPNRSASTEDTAHEADKRKHFQRLGSATFVGMDGFNSPTPSAGGRGGLMMNMSGRGGQPTRRRTFHSTPSSNSNSNSTAEEHEGLVATPSGNSAAAAAAMFTMPAPRSRQAEAPPVTPIVRQNTPTTQKTPTEGENQSGTPVRAVSMNMRRSVASSLFSPASNEKEEEEEVGAEHPVEEGGVFNNNKQHSESDYSINSTYSVHNISNFSMSGATDNTDIVDTDNNTHHSSNNPSKGIAQQGIRTSDAADSTTSTAAAAILSENEPTESLSIANSTAITKSAEAELPAMAELTTSNTMSSISLSTPPTHLNNLNITINTTEQPTNTVTTTATATATISPSPHHPTMVAYEHPSMYTSHSPLTRTITTTTTPTNTSTTNTITNTTSNTTSNTTTTSTTAAAAAVHSSSTHSTSQNSIDDMTSNHITEVSTVSKVNGSENIHPTIATAATATTSTTTANIIPSYHYNHNHHPTTSANHNTSANKSFVAPTYIQHPVSYLKVGKGTVGVSTSVSAMANHSAPRVTQYTHSDTQPSSASTYTSTHANTHTSTNASTNATTHTSANAITNASTNADNAKAIVSVGSVKDRIKTFETLSHHDHSHSDSLQNVKRTPYRRASLN